jgi:hypothetical protein
MLTMLELVLDIVKVSVVMPPVCVITDVEPFEGFVHVVVPVGAGLVTCTVVSEVRTVVEVDTVASGAELALAEAELVPHADIGQASRLLPPEDVPLLPLYLAPQIFLLLLLTEASLLR